jgi:hypothetical protein
MKILIPGISGRTGSLVAEEALKGIAAYTFSFTFTHVSGFRFFLNL